MRGVVARVFPNAYLACLVAYTAWSLAAPVAPLWLSVASVFGRGNLWLFGPDPPSVYQHLTACWQPITARHFDTSACDGPAVFASYHGDLAEALRPATKPTRDYRVAEQLLGQLPLRDQAIAALASQLMRSSRPRATGRACFRVLLHTARLADGPPTRFDTRVVWQRCP